MKEYLKFIGSREGKVYNFIRDLNEHGPVFEVISRQPYNTILKSPSNGEWFINDGELHEYIPYQALNITIDNELFEL